MEGKKELLGIACEGRLQVLLPESLRGATVRLTKMAMQESLSPESKEISLRDAEGRVVLVTGRHNGEWVYWAELVEVGGLIQTRTIQQLFDWPP